MSALTRTRSGNFYIEDSVKIEDFKKIVSEGKLNEVLLPVEKVLKEYKKVHISSEAEKYMINGNKINLVYLKEKNTVKGEKVAAIDCNERIVGIYEAEEEFIKPVTMLI